MGAATSKLFLGPVMYDNSLRTPHVINLPFLCACLPKAITQHRALPFMQDSEQSATCRSICLPKAMDDQIKFKKGTVEGKVYWLLVCVQGGPGWTGEPF